MTDPVRLTNDRDVPPELRRALRMERRREPPPALHASVRAVVLARLAPTAAAAGIASAAANAVASAGAAGTASAGAVAAGSLLKAFVVGVGLGGVVMGTSALVRRASEPASSALPPHTANSVEATRPAGAPLGAQEPPSRVHTPRADPGGSSAPSKPTAPAMTELPGARVRAPARPAVSPVRREAARVAEARELVRRGAAAEALHSLEALDAKAESGVLAQERESLRIEALVTIGRASEAEKAAQSFLERHPESPHAARVRSWFRSTSSDPR